MKGSNLDAPPHATVSRRKGTKYLRVRIDFSIELKEATDNSAVFDVRRFHDLAHSMLCAAIREADTHDRAVGTAPGFSTSVGLDMRKRDEKGKVTL